MRARWIGVGGFALLFGLALVLVRGDPTATSDQGVFLSVAARILDGDDLYSEVIDNKDPLFFYTYAAALWIGGWRGPFLLDGIWLGVAALSFALLLREVGAPRLAVIAGFFVYPLALTSGWYAAGLSMLASLAIAPLAAWLWLRRSYAASGALLAAAMLFKLNLAAVAAAPIVAFALFGAPEGRRGRPVVRAGLGLFATLAAASVLLAARGELGAYVDTITYNVHYSNALLGAQSVFGRIEGHFDIVLEYFRAAGKWQLPAALMVLAVFLVAASLAWTRMGRRHRLLAAASVATLALTLGTLALTAYWRHHLQMLAYPAALVVATLISVASGIIGRRAGSVLAAACVLFALWSSARSEGHLEVSRAWTSTPVSAGATALEDARMRFYARSPKVTYMVFGGNSENAHAAFIGGEVDLVCRWFHLYPHSLEEQFDETLACAERETPMLVLVTLGFFELRSTPTSWGTFVSRAGRLLESRYELVATAHPGFQVWKQTASREASGENRLSLRRW